MLVVRALPTKNEAWPACLKDERGHTVLGFFFLPEPPDEGTRPYGWADADADDPNFVRALSSLAGMVQKRLFELRENRLLREKEETSHTSARPERPVIYLHARPEDETAWTSTSEVLKAAGYRVLPEAPSVAPSNGGLDGMLQASLQRVKDCVDADALLILRPEDGNWIADQAKATGRMEREHAEAQRGRPLPCAVLNQADGDLLGLAGLDIDLLRGQGDHWLRELESWLDKKFSPASETVA